MINKILNFFDNFVSKIINNERKNIYYFIFLFVLIFILTFFNKDSWAFVAFSIFATIIIYGDKIFKNIRYLKIGKEGLEFEKIKEEAESVIEELKKMALLSAESILTSIDVRDSHNLMKKRTLKEIYQKQKTIRESLKKLNISDNEVDEKLSSSKGDVIYYYFQEYGKINTQGYIDDFIKGDINRFKKYINHSVYCENKDEFFDNVEYYIKNNNFPEKVEEEILNFNDEFNNEE